MSLSSANTTMADQSTGLFLNLLVQQKALTEEDSKILAGKYSDSLELYENLESLNKVSQETLVKSYARANNISYIEIQSIDEKAFSIIDKDLAKKFGFIPFSIDEPSKMIQIAMADPSRFKSLNETAKKALSEKLGYKIEFFLTSKAALDRLHEKPKEASDQLKPIEPIQSAQEIQPQPVAPQPTPQLSSQPNQNPQNQAENTQKKDEPVTDIFAGIETAGDQNFTTDENQPVNGQDNLELTKFLGKDRVDINDIKTFANSGQIPQLLAGLLFMAIGDRASDIHIEPFEKVVRARFRIDGELNDIILLPAGMNASLVARVKILSQLKIDEQRVPQDGRFETAVGPNGVDIRVSTLPTVFGEKIVMRLLPKSKSLDSLEELGLDGLGYDRVIKASAKPYGVILSTGPTGSGKTTSLYSILYRLNRPEVNIITLEDPVEYEIAGINQVQIKPQIGFGFADGLRSVLRQDPNVVMVGEIRDKETAELVTHAALTGHLVLSTLHTNDAASALPRLYNLGVEPFLLTSAVNAVIGQRLVRRVCQKCKQEIQVPQSVSFEVKKEMEKINFSQSLKFYKGKGCDQCKNGFKGRVAIFEVLDMSNAIEDLVIQKKPSSEILAEAIKEGMITMKQDGFIKAIKGLTTVDEVMRVTSEAKEG